MCVCYIFMHKQKRFATQTKDYKMFIIDWKTRKIMSNRAITSKHKNNTCFKNLVTCRVALIIKLILF